MRQQSRGTTYQPPNSFILKLIRKNIPVVLFLILAFVGMIAVYWYFNPNAGTVEARVNAALEGGIEANDPTLLRASIVKPVERLPVIQRLTQSPGPILVGIIAGHRASDSGTECEDGLTEVQITNGLAERLAKNLQDLGVAAETLDEFDDRLDGYRATALVSIHVDSCEFVNELATGYKISGSPYTDSSSLSICIQQAYGQATELPYHPHSITPHMAEYHAFRKLGDRTPAIIIEVGFLNLDREILTVGSDLVVEGLTDGILCYLEEHG
jgi:N-acetylmuramoyl-L-alanine amidase